MLVAGVDGARAGWIAVLRDLASDASPDVLLVPRFADLLERPESPTLIAVDMPIGLPERAGSGGRGPERLVRPLLGERQSSVFSIPSRAAVYCDDYREACRVALETSDPPRKVSKQAFNIFPKIREIDALMSAQMEAVIYEVHPEVAFWRLNGERPMSLPKKVRSRANGPGLDERRDLLERHGFERAFLDQPPPRGAGRDDFIDACVNALIAERIMRGLARPFPEPPERDARGFRMAIWA
ncbi:DUF429 domain-containing protein [Stappia sp. F7233]|uniref:DUF429 domain-containing protein n=1 Tax=Stappia albiluteola TaxID=2758565 RepID=A0A839AJ95_9HYPH|nr:DUF429 domain-containing protein [Stappia albiluteola]MBA5778982.1 DUF429 domain-containing protein [Stappia albiluteola]